jgi:hypothetical protein
LPNASPPYARPRPLRRIGAAQNENCCRNLEFLEID